MAITSTVPHYIFSIKIVVAGQKLTQCRCVPFRMNSSKCPANRSTKALGFAVLQLCLWPNWAPFIWVSTLTAGSCKSFKCLYLRVSSARNEKVLRPLQDQPLAGQLNELCLDVLKMFAAICFYCIKIDEFFQGHYLHQNQPVLIRQTSLQEQLMFICFWCHLLLLLQ